MHIPAASLRSKTTFIYISYRLGAYKPTGGIQFQYEEHKLEHKRLIEKANNLKRKFVRGDMASYDAFEFIVHEIIIGHTLKEDTKFFTFIH